MHNIARQKLKSHFRFYASDKLYVFPMSRCRTHGNICIFFASHEYWTDFDEIWGGNAYHQQINWLRFYQGQGSKIGQKIRIDVKPVLPRSEWLHRFHSTQWHVAAAELASPLHTCSGGGIIWPHAVFSSLANIYFISILFSLFLFIWLTDKARFWRPGSIEPQLEIKNWQNYLY